VKFLVDAQLPRRFAFWLISAGHDARHTLDLEQGNRTADTQISAIADAEDRVVITKDDDFVQSFLIDGRPRRLLLVSTGNVANVRLEEIIRINLDSVVAALTEHRFVEVSLDAMVIHE
jgi:predicted nuclease of predicted toxin-antitoxin system